jgi:rRNA-processing protein FCF1
MNEYILDVIRKYKNKGVVVDANILLLYVVGTFDLSLIRNFKRTSSFTENQFDRVSKFIEKFSRTITAPHILTEVDDLLGNRVELRAVLAAYIKNSIEHHSEASLLIEGTYYTTVGIADSAIYDLARNNYLIFTDDGLLHNILSKSGLDVVKLDYVTSI